MKKFLLGLCLTGFILDSFGLTQVNLALDWYVNPDHAPILAAETQGFFKENGLAVNLIEPTQTSEVRNLVAAGEATVGIDYEPETLIAIAKGLPLEIAGNLVPVPLSCIMTLKSSGINTLSDFRNKTLGYSGNAMDRQFLQLELKEAGINPDTVTLQPIHMDLTQALLAHAVDGVSGVMRNVEPVMLGQMGIATQLFYPEAHGIPPYSGLIFIAKTGIDPTTISAFLKAVGEGAAYVKAHPESAWQAAAKAYPAQLASSAKISAENHAIWLASVPYFTTAPQNLDLKAIARFKAFLTAQGLMS